MSSDLVRRIEQNPKYQQMKRTRNTFGWTLTFIMLAVYYGYILIIAFDKSLLAARIGDGVMTVGIPVGIGIIIFTIAITGFYVQRANTTYDDLTATILKEDAK